MSAELFDEIATAIRLSHLDQKQSWRQRLGWLAGELIVVFAGVSAAFVVENYRDNSNQIDEMHQAVAGIIAELTAAERKTASFVTRSWQISAVGRTLIGPASALFLVATEFQVRRIHHQQRAIALLHRGWLGCWSPSCGEISAISIRSWLGFTTITIGTTNPQSARCYQRHSLNPMRFTDPTDVYFLCFAFIWIYRKNSHKTCRG